MTDTMTPREGAVLTNRLSRIMGERRVTMQDVVRATGLSRQTLHDLYHDKSARLDLSTLDKLCDYFQVGPEQIFEWRPSQPAEQER